MKNITKKTGSFGVTHLLLLVLLLGSFVPTTSVFADNLPPSAAYIDGYTWGYADTILSNPYDDTNEYDAPEDDEYRDGYKDGNRDGLSYLEGVTDGIPIGWDNGFDDASSASDPDDRPKNPTYTPPTPDHDQFYNAGYKDGHDSGYEDGFEMGISFWWGYNDGYRDGSNGWPYNDSDANVSAPFDTAYRDGYQKGFYDGNNSPNRPLPFESLRVLVGTQAVYDRTGQEGSKINVNGVPMPDVKPGRSSESDYTKEETYVDALTRDLHHEVTDIYIPFAAGGQLALTVRRNLMQAMDSTPWESNDWSSTDPTYQGDEDQFETDPELSPANYHFGPCWISSLDCGLQICSSFSFNPKRSVSSMDSCYHLIYIVIDENGQSYRFVKLEDGTFSPVCSSTSGISEDTVSLVETTNSYIFSRRYGTTITYDHDCAGAEGCADITRISADQIVIGDTSFGCMSSNTVTSFHVAAGDVGVSFSRDVRTVTATDGEIKTYITANGDVATYTTADGEVVPRNKTYERREYYHPKQVEDRFGNRLVYSFEGGNLSEIMALNSTQTNSDLKLIISGNTITDPNGNVTSYGLAGSLISVSGPGGTVRYEYGRVMMSQLQCEYSNHWERVENYYADGQDSDGTLLYDSDPAYEYAMWGFSGRDYSHTFLTAVEDENGNRYEFAWTNDASSHVTQDWLERSGEDLPDLDWGDFGTIPDGSISLSEETGIAYPFHITEIRKGNDVAYFSELGTDGLSVTDMEGNRWDYSFGGATAVASQDCPALGVIGNEFMSPCPSVDSVYTSISINTGDQFQFELDAALALSRSMDSFGNETRWSFADPAGAASLFAWLNRPTAETNALNYGRSYTYESFFNQKKSITDEFARDTEFQFDDLGNRTNAVLKDASGSILAVTEMAYTDEANPGFMTRKIVKDMNDPDDPAWAGDLVTEYEPHAYGQVGRKIVDPDGLHLETVYDYDKNNNLIKVIDPNGNMTTNGYDSLNRLTEIAFFDGTNTLKCTKRFWYDPRGNKTCEKDENDHYSYFEYDSRNNCTSTVRIMGSCSDPSSGTNRYTAAGEDIVTASEYNALSLLTATVDARGLRTEFQYDHLQRLTNTVVGAGTSDAQVTAYEYGLNSGSLLFSSDKWKPVKVTDPRGYVTETVYDALYRPVQIKAEVSNGVYALTLNTYDDVGNLIAVSNQVAGGVWQITRTLYDPQDRPVCVINPDGTSNTVAYTSTGLKWKLTDELGRESEIQYDTAGRPVKTFSPELAGGIRAVTETGYDAGSNPQWSKDANGNITTNLYDFRNRPVQTIAPRVWDADNSSSNCPVVSTLYDPVGNVLSATDARGNSTTNFYDPANRLVATWAPEVDVYGLTNSIRPATTNIYDKGGNIIATIDANGRTVQMQYDLFGRLTNTVDAVGNTISFEYDPNGNQTALIDGNGSRTEFVYDGLNRKISTIYPDANHEDAQYDLLGNRIKRIDCNGAVTWYDYDLRNRLDFVRYGTDPFDPDRTRDYTYDLAGNLLAVDETPSTNNQQLATNVADVAYTYDSLNRVVTETSAGATHHYQYDLNGNRTNALYGVTGRDVSWTYDALNRISTILTASTNSTVLTTTYSYDLNSKPVYRLYPTGVQEFRTFDAINRLLSMTTTNSANGQSFAMDYSYDAVGSAREMVQSSWNLDGKAQDALTQWSYDDRYRLINETVTVSGSTNATSYSWDNADNRLSKTVTVSTNSTFLTVSTTLYTNNALNQIVGYTETNSVSSVYSVVDYSYDPNGARTNKTVATSTPLTNSTVSTIYSYDEDNRLLSASVDSVVSSFAYDYRSRRTYRSTPTETNLCVFDGGLTIQEYNATDIGLSDFGLSTTNLQTEFIRGEGMGGGVGGMVYSIKHPAPGSELPASIICSHANHRGDVIARSDSTGSLTSFSLYEAYGTRPYEWGDDPDRQKANTKEEEKDLGLLNEGMRYRDLETGTFLTRDPIGYTDGPNIYCYVHCNPITHFDAFGLFENEEDADYGRAAIERLEQDKDFSESKHGEKTIAKLWELFDPAGKDGSGVGKDSRMTFGDLSAKGRNGEYKAAGKNGSITFDNSLRGSGNSKELSATAAHEGTHGVQHDQSIAAGEKAFTPTFEREVEAYTVQAFVETRLYGNAFYPTEKDIVTQVANAEPQLTRNRRNDPPHQSTDSIDYFSTTMEAENLKQCGVVTQADRDALSKIRGNSKQSERRREPYQKSINDVYKTHTPWHDPTVRYKLPSSGFNPTTW